MTRDPVHRRFAFQNSLWYCKDRKSMRALSGTKDPDSVTSSSFASENIPSQILQSNQGFDPCARHLRTVRYALTAHVERVGVTFDVVVDLTIHIRHSVSGGISLQCTVAMCDLGEPVCCLAGVETSLIQS